MRKDIRIAGFGVRVLSLQGLLLEKQLHFTMAYMRFKPSLMVLKLGEELLKLKLLSVTVKWTIQKFQNPDIFIAMSHPALMAYLDDLKDGGILIVDPDMISEEEVMPFVQKHNIKLYKAPASRTAAEVIGLKVVANIVMVGAITRITKVVSEEAVRAAIAESVPPGTEEKNLAAYDAGLKLA